MAIVTADELRDRVRRMAVPQVWMTVSQLKVGDIIEVNRGCSIGAIRGLRGEVKAAQSKGGRVEMVWVDLPGSPSTTANGRWCLAATSVTVVTAMKFNHPQAKATITMKPEPPCPHCDIAWVKAAPEHVSAPRKTIKRTGFLLQAMLEYDCKCWRCSRTWTHAVETT